MLSDAINRFGPLPNGSALAVAPERVDIVEAARDQTLGEFAQEFPSAIPIRELAVINHLPDASARIKAGTLIKRVVS